jgi:hypothetical protein
MRHVRAALVGLAVAVLLTTAVFGVEMVSANRRVAAQMAGCESALNGGGGICSGSAPFGGKELPAVFALGFVAGYAWTFRPRRAVWRSREGRTSE